jgi:hypothetical protein
MPARDSSSNNPAVNQPSPAPATSASQTSQAGEFITPTQDDLATKGVRAQKAMVAMSFRISRQDWERLHHLAVAEGVSINTLTLRGLSKLFEARGLPGIGR